MNCPPHNTFPKFSRICPQDRLCEGTVSLKSLIRDYWAIEKHITETAFDQGWATITVTSRMVYQQLLLGLGWLVWLQQMSCAGRISGDCV